ncbi:MAG: hypothetical protein ACRDQG_12155 [Pseudonocardiaceae bacterium]
MTANLALAVFVGGLVVAGALVTLAAGCLRGHGDINDLPEQGWTEDDDRMVARAVVMHRREEQS